MTGHGNIKKDPCTVFWLWFRLRPFLQSRVSWDGQSRPVTQRKERVRERAKVASHADRDSEEENGIWTRIRQQQQKTVGLFISALYESTTNDISNIVGRPRSDQDWHHDREACTKLK